MEIGENNVTKKVPVLVLKTYEKAGAQKWETRFLCKGVQNWTKTCKRGASRLGEAWPRPRLGRKTYWHEDKARLTGTRNYIILLLKSQQS